MSDTEPTPPHPPTAIAKVDQTALVTQAKADLLTRRFTDAAEGGLARRGNEPQSLAEQTALAQALSALGAVQVPVTPNSMETRSAEPGEILGRILTGASMGFPAMQSIRGLYEIGGKHGVYVKLMHAKVRAHALCKELRVIYSGTDKAVWFAWRAGDQQGQEVDFTWEDAKTAGLVEKKMWRAWPRRMLLARALGEAMLLVWPDVCEGMPLAEELIEGIYEDARTPSPETIREREAEMGRGYARAPATPTLEVVAPPKPAAPPPPESTAVVLSRFLDDARKAGARSKREIEDAVIAVSDQADPALLTVEQRAAALKRIADRVKGLTSPEASAGARGVLAEARGGQDIAPPLADDDIPF